jgi:TolB-like protein
MRSGAHEYPFEQIQAQLARILATDAFRRSPSLGRFLKYLVDRAVEGELGIKEYRLGLEVFDRGQDFDPRDDTIVRVQARKVRARLDEYNKDPASIDTIRFVLLKGAYAIHFEEIERPAVVSFDPTPLKTTRPGWSRRAKVAAAAALIGALAAGVSATRHFSGSAESSPPEPLSLLVAAFTNISADRDNEYFASGLTEELTNELANLAGLRVVARASSVKWKDKELDFGNLRQLGIDDVVQGSVRKEGSKLRISVRLVQVATGSHLWSHEYDREVRDSIATEREIAGAVAAALKVRFSPVALRPPTSPSNPDAYELYLKGRYSWLQVDAEGADRGIAYLERSLSLDPSFAPAYVALAGCYATRVIYYRIPAVEGYAKDREMALKALQLDDTLAEAHTMLAGVYAWNDWNWERSELEFRAGEQLAPQGVIAHQYYASFLGALGRQSEAETLMQQAIHLDPLDSLLQWAEAQLMFWRGDVRDSEAILIKITKRDPEFGLTAKLLAEVEWVLGKDGEAEATLRAHLAKHPSDPIPLGELGYTLGKTGRRREAAEILKQLQEQARLTPVPPQALAFVYQGLGEDEKAIDELREASDARTLRVPWLRVEPVYAPLRHNPRWAALLQHVNLQVQ